ncbi:MAG: hypothetical protein ACHQD8_00600, partial [Chitinophagales bacterium]
INSFNKKLLPFSFHTHPTKSDDYLQEFMSYLNQLNTSDEDQMCSLYGIHVGEINLRLPDILIVGNGTQCLDVFVGFYNGLICPTSFKEYKQRLITKTSDNFLEWIENNIDTPQKKIFAGIAVSIALTSMPLSV